MSHSDCSLPLHNKLLTKKKVELRIIVYVFVSYQVVESKSLIQRQNLSRAGILVVTPNQFIKVLSEHLAS